MREVARARTALRARRLLYPSFRVRAPSRRRRSFSQAPPPRQKAGAAATAAAVGHWEPARPPACHRAARPVPPSRRHRASRFRSLLLTAPTTRSSSLNTRSPVPRSRLPAPRHLAPYSATRFKLPRAVSSAVKGLSARPRLHLGHPRSRRPLRLAQVPLAPAPQHRTQAPQHAV